MSHQENSILYQDEVDTGLPAENRNQNSLKFPWPFLRILAFPWPISIYIFSKHPPFSRSLLKNCNFVWFSRFSRPCDLVKMLKKQHHPLQNKRSSANFNMSKITCNITQIFQTVFLHYYLHLTFAVKWFKLKASPVESFMSAGIWQM